MSSDLSIPQNPDNTQFQLQQLQSAQQDQQITPVSSNGTVDMNARFSNYNDFAKTYPELHKAMMNGIANNIISDMKNHQQRMHDLMKEAEREMNEG